MKIAKILFSCLALGLSLNLFAEPVQETMPEETVQTEVAAPMDQDQCFMEKHKLYDALSRNLRDGDGCIDLNLTGVDMGMSEFENASVSAFICEGSGLAFVMSVFEEGCTQMGIFIGRSEDMGWTPESSSFSEEQSMVVRSQLNCVEASLFAFSSNQETFEELVGTDPQELQNELAGADVQANLQELSDELCVDEESTEGQQ